MPSKTRPYFPTKTRVIIWVPGYTCIFCDLAELSCADKLLIRLCKDSKACSGSRPLGISEDADAVLCHSVSMGFSWGYNFYKWNQKGPEKWGFTVFFFHPERSGVISPYFISLVLGGSLQLVSVVNNRSHG